MIEHFKGCKRLHGRWDLKKNGQMCIMTVRIVLILCAGGEGDGELLQQYGLFYCLR